MIFCKFIQIFRLERENEQVPRLRALPSARGASQVKDDGRETAKLQL